MTSQIHSLPSYQQVTKKTLWDRDNILAQETNQLPWENTTKSDLDHINTSNTIWVPAAKHPQIAPSEFLEWIKTHGGTTPDIKNPVKRQKSTLSTTYTSSEEEDDDEDDDDDDKDDNHLNLEVGDDDLPANPMNPIGPIDTTTNLTDREYSIGLYRHALPLDASPVLASQEKSALSRRKALSSRGQHIPRQQASIKHATARKPSDNNNFTYDNNTTGDKLTDLSSNGIRLYDQPISINEWMDLGNVIETNSSQQHPHQIAAETHALTRQISAPKATSPSVPPPPTRKRQELRRSVSDRLSWTTSVGKKGTSWIRELFGKYRAANDESNQNPSNMKSTATFIPVTTSPSLSTQVSSAAMPSPPLSISSSSSFSAPSFTPATPSPPMSRSSSLNPISYLSRKLSLSTSKPEKQVNRHPRRRYSNFLFHGKNSPRKHQVMPMEIDHTENEQRLPLHMERGVYRLSHMKLANPRRPLREQVIISNFMFWYLSIINMHPQQIQQQQQQQLNHHTNLSSNHQYTNNPAAPSLSLLSSSSPLTCEPEIGIIQLEKQSSPISHPVHMPLKRPPTTGISKDFPEIVNTTPASPLALKNKKDKYKPIKNTYFGKQIPNYTPS